MKRAGRWEATAESRAEENMAEMAYGGGVKCHKAEQDGAAAPPAAPKTIAQKRLAKVSTKGMRTMMSF